MRVEWTTRSLKQMKKLKDQQIISKIQPEPSPNAGGEERRHAIYDGVF